jgi:CRP-like cAMP-binding protein
VIEMFRRTPKVGLSNGQQALVGDAMDVVTQLRHSQLFSGFSDLQLKEIAELSTVRTYGEQDVIFNQGDLANALHVVATGNVALVRQITKPITGEKMQVTVDILRAGQSLGWSSLVEPHHSYTLTARALSRVELIVIDSANFNAWRQRSAAVEMQVLKNLNALLAQRLQRAYDSLNV